MVGSATSVAEFDATTLPSLVGSIPSVSASDTLAVRYEQASAFAAAAAMVPTDHPLFDLVDTLRTQALNPAVSSDGVGELSALLSEAVGSYRPSSALVTAPTMTAPMVQAQGSGSGGATQVVERTAQMESSTVNDATAALIGNTVHTAVAQAMNEAPERHSAARTDDRVKGQSGEKAPMKPESRGTIERNTERVIERAAEGVSADGVRDIMREELLNAQPAVSEPRAEEERDAGKYTDSKRPRRSGLFPFTKPEDDE